jgi:hypothetical protein
MARVKTKWCVVITEHESDPFCSAKVFIDGIYSADITGTDTATVRQIARGFKASVEFAHKRKRG